MEQPIEEALLVVVEIVDALQMDNNGRHSDALVGHPVDAMFPHAGLPDLPLGGENPSLGIASGKAGVVQGNHFPLIVVNR